MKTINVRGKIIKLYDSIDDMPIVNFQKYNKYVLLDTGLGSDIDSIDEHIVNLAKHIKSSNVAKAMQELQNLRQNMHMIVCEISPKYMAFAALIHSIDGEHITDLSDDNLKYILDKIKDIKHSWVIDFLTWVKKKLGTELELYFPSSFDGAKEKELYDKLKQRVILILQGIIEDTDTSKEVDDIDDYLFSLYSPKSFVGAESAEIKYEKQFETSCMLISQKTGILAKKMTVLEFYNTLGIIEKQADAEVRAYKRVKR